MWCSGAHGLRIHAPRGIRSHGITKNGAIILAARTTPYRIGSVLHPAASSPFMSEKSLVVDAPSRNRKKIAPMNHGSRWNTDATMDQPATLSRQPRGIAI